MTRRVRFANVILFFAFWILSIVARLTYLALFGPYAAVRYSPSNLIIGFVMAILVAASFNSTDLSQIIRVAKKTSGSAVPIDLLHAKATARRTELAIICLVVFMATLAFNISAGSASRFFIWISAGLSVISVLRVLLLQFRVRSQEFGNTADEARQLLTLLARLYKDDEAQPPGPLPPTKPGDAKPMLFPANVASASQ